MNLILNQEPTFFKENLNSAREVLKTFYNKSNIDYKHIMHPFDDLFMTFEDMKDIIKRGFDNSFSDIGFDTEKIDGIALAFTVKNGQIRYARNKGHVLNGAETALKSENIPLFFNGKPYVIKVMELASKTLTDYFLKEEDFFKDGHVFINLDIVNSLTKNVIEYPDNRLYLHGCIHYDDSGNILDKNFVDLYSTFYKESMDEKISFVNKIKYDRKNLDFSKRDLFLQKIDYLITTYGCNNVFEFLILSLSYYYENYLEIHDINKLLKISLRTITKNKNIYPYSIIKKETDANKADAVIYFEKYQYSYVKRSLLNYLETVFFCYGKYIKSTVINYVSAEKNYTYRILFEIEKIKSKIEIETDNKLIRKFYYNYNILMHKMNDLKDLNPFEGIVFTYKSKIYKLTGDFSPINQILGIYRY